MTVPLVPAAPTFLGLPACTDLATLDAHVAVVGIPHGVPYDMAGVHSDAAEAPRAIRAHSQRFVRMLSHFDFDLGGDLLAGGACRVVDCGDVPADPGDLPGNTRRATDAVRSILGRGALPVVLGGDDSIPPLVVRAYEGIGLPITVVQVDAHLDYRDEVDGVREGYSSPMRRCAELPFVERIVHVGLRGVGSARARDVEDSLARGNLLVTADDLHAHGVGWLLDQLPSGGRFFVTIDCDGLDPSIAPGTRATLPGGLTYHQARALLRGLDERGRIVGIDVVEHFPALDVGGATAVLIARLLVNVVGAAARRLAGIDDLP